MNEVVIQICEQLKQEAQTVIDYMKNGSAVVASGEEHSVETVSLFNDLAIDGVEHCQKLVIALSNCFFQNAKQPKEETKE